MRVVELLVGVLDTLLAKPLGQDARSVLYVVLVAPAAIDENTLQRLEVVPITLDQVNRVVPQPLSPSELQ